MKTKFDLAVSKSVMSCVTPEVKDLYRLLEKEYLPMDLASKVQPLLSRILKLSAKLATTSSVPEVQLSKFKRLTCRSDVSISAQEYKSYSHRPKYRHTGSNPLPNIPGLPVSRHFAHRRTISILEHFCSSTFCTCCV